MLRDLTDVPLYLPTFNDASSSLLTTKVQLVLKDCNDQSDLYESPFWEEVKKKIIRNAFHEAITYCVLKIQLLEIILTLLNHRIVLKMSAVVEVAETPKVLPKVKQVIAENKVVANTPITDTKAQKPATVNNKCSLCAGILTNGFQLVDTYSQSDF